MVRELKHTEIGDIPVDWELQTFDETFRVISNNTLSRENLNNCGGAVRNIHYGDILTKFPEVLDCNEEEIPYINELSLLSSSTQLLQDGDIVVADTAEDETVGKVIEVQNLGDSKLVAGLHTIPCRVKKGDFAPGWLGYYMNSDLFHNQILPYITGIKVSSISKGAISETLILVPPFDEQEKIVQSLNKIQLLMTAETKVVNKIKLVKNGCLSKMFPQKDDTVPEMRLPGFTEAWEQRKLGELVKEGILEAPLDGNHGEKHPTSDEYVESGIPFLMASDIHNGEVNIYSCKYITKERAERLDKGFARNGDVLLTHKATIGETAILSNLMTEYAMLTPQVTYYRIKNEERLNREYLYSFFNSLDFQTELKTKAAQSTRPYIGITAQQNLKIILPTEIDEQRKIGLYFGNLDRLITLHQRKCDEVKSLKKYMLQKMFPQNEQKVPEIRFEGFTEAWEQRKLGEVFKEYSEKNHTELSALTIIQGGGTVKREESDRNLMYDKSNLSNYKMVRKNDFIVHLRSFEGGLEKSLLDGIISPAYHTFHSDVADSRFYYPYFRSHEFIKHKLVPHVYGIRDGRSIDIAGMKTIEIPYTSIEEQRKIGDYLESLDHLITLHQQKCEELKKIKKFMLQKMFV